MTSLGEAVSSKQAVPPAASPFSPLKMPTAAIHFDSKSEAVIALLLEKYAPKWRCVVGETYHIQVGRGQVDFKVGEIFFEFHPIVLRRSFINSQAHHDLMQALHRIKPAMKRNILSAISAELSSQYWKQRRTLLDANGHKDAKLVIAHNSGELYDRLIFAEGWEGVPSRQGFVREFERLLRKV